MVFHDGWKVLMITSSTFRLAKELLLVLSYCSKLFFSLLSGPNLRVGDPPGPMIKVRVGLNSLSTRPELCGFCFCLMLDKFIL